MFEGINLDNWRHDKGHLYISPTEDSAVVVYKGQAGGIDSIRLYSDPYRGNYGRVLSKRTQKTIKR